jgi:hypothetical protein
MVNRAVAGTARRARPGIPKGLLAVLGGSLAASLAGGFLLGETLWFRYHSVEARATATTVGERQTCTRNVGRSGSEKYACRPVTYEFTTREGRGATLTRRHDEHDRPAVGERFTIRYDPKDPEDARFPSASSGLYGVGVGALLAGVAGTVLSTVLLLRHHRTGTTRPGRPVAAD